jgi:hypothetical protein
MQDLILTTEHKRRIKMKTKNDWKMCRQARWENGDIVQLEELYSGKHRITVKALGMETSYELPSYAGWVHYDKWVEDVKNGVLE